MQTEIEKDPMQAIEVVVFERGEEILSEGQESQSFHVILIGQVMLSKNGKTVRILGERDIFGLESFLLRKPFYYTAEAVQKCRIARYGPETLDHLMHESPRMIRNLLVSILHQLNQTTLNLVAPPQTVPGDEERVHFYEDGEVILQETNGGTDIFRLISTQGGLQVTKGARELTRINKPGEFFGLPISRSNVCVKSIGQSVVERYGTEDLDIIIKDYPESAGQMMRTMIERLSDNELDTNA